LIIAANTNSFGTANTGDILSKKAKRQVTNSLENFGHFPLGLDAVANLTPKNF
jgi:hypothetical protein